MYIEITLSIQMSCKRNFSLTGELILMKLYGVVHVVNDLKMCMKKDIAQSNPCGVSLVGGQF